MLAKLPDKEIYNLEKTLVKLEKDTDPIFQEIPGYPNEDERLVQKNLLLKNQQRYRSVDDIDTRIKELSYKQNAPVDEK